MFDHGTNGNRRPFSARPRRADRRPGLHALVRQVAALAHRRWCRICSGTVRAAHAARAGASRAGRGQNDAIGPAHPIVAGDYAAFAAPGDRKAGSRSCEASFGSGQRPDEWTCQLLESAASPGGARHGRRSCDAARRGARPRNAADVAPLIGSSEVMQALRERVERVATTDFTGAHRRRERRRQGAGRAADSRAAAGAGTARSSPSTAPRWSRR